MARQNRKSVNRDKNKLRKQNGVVVFLDALGMKGVWRDKKTAKTITRWEKFIEEFERYVRSQKLKSYTFTAFSDTVIITKNDPCLESALIETGRMLISPFGYAMLQGIHFRGAISVGEFYVRDTVILGKAVDEAAQYYTMPEWVGISAAPSTHRILQKIKEERGNKNNPIRSFTQCDIPIKNGLELNGWALKWPEYDNYLPSLSQSVRRNYNSLREIILNELERSEEINTAFKWRNTLDFFDSIRS